MHLAPGVDKNMAWPAHRMHADATAAADNYIRFGMRVGAVLLPFLMGGLNDHMPGDYCQSIVNSDPAAWQPFK
jgi:hypothetical protein